MPLVINDARLGELTINDALCPVGGIDRCRQGWH